MKHWYLLLAAVGLCSCSGTTDVLSVKQFYVRDQKDDNNIEPMIRGEKNRIFHGAVSMEERRQRLGQYYTVQWHDPDGAASSYEVVFEFQQGASGSQIKRRSQKFSDETSGSATFTVIGDDYFKNGKVLAWRISLLRDGREISSKRSYLWE